MSEWVALGRPRAVPPVGAELLLTLLFGHAYAVADGGHRVRGSGADPPLARRQSDYPVADNLSAERARRRAATDRNVIRYALITNYDSCMRIQPVSRFIWLNVSG